MSILDLSNYLPLRFDFASKPQTYDYEQPEKLLVLLKQVVNHPRLELLMENYELKYSVYSAPQYITSIDEHGTPLSWKEAYEPRAHRVTLHPRLFLLCLRCDSASHSNLVHLDELVRHLEAELLRRKLRALIE